MPVDAADKKFAKQGILNALGEDALEYAKKQILVERIEHLSEWWRTFLTVKICEKTRLASFFASPRHLTS